jgi:hypothetical protein
MPINIGARQFAKAQRRKAAVAAKRKAEIDGNTIAGRIRLAAADPIQRCVVSDSLANVGLGNLIVARGATKHSLTMAAFLIDVRMGVKDVFSCSMSGKEFDAHIDQLSIASRMVAVEPAQARFLVNQLVAGARERGYLPHPDFLKIEPIFGAVRAISWAEAARIVTAGGALSAQDDLEMMETEDASSD